MNFDVKVVDSLGAECTQPVTIVVNSACPDWTTLLWNIPYPYSVVNGSFTPFNTASDSFSSSLNGGVAQSFNSATYVYNGSGCNCNLHLDYNGPAWVGVTCKISSSMIDPPNTLVLCVKLLAGTGIYDIPFSLPDTLGVPISFYVIIHPKDSDGPLTLNGTFSNVP